MISFRDFEIIQEGDIYFFYILEVFYEDVGKFLVIVENFVGKFQC